MKNKMHACLAAVVALTIIAGETQGSMQYVFAGSFAKPITKTEVAKMTVLSAEKEGVDDIDEGEVSVIDIKVNEASKSESSAKADLSGEVAGIPYSKLVMANVDEAVNVRAEATEESEILGKFYSECAGLILEKGSGWTKIQTGKLTGWVKNDYLFFDETARELADSVVEKVATSKTSCLRVRKEPNQDAGVYDLLAEGDEIEVVEELGDWVSVEFSDGTIGYVSAEYVDISDELAKGETMESIKAREDKLKKDKEAAAKSKDSGKASQSKAEPTVTNNGAIAGEVNDVMLLAALIQSEAGNECYEGQVSVGSVVMNRLRSGRYGNSLYSVIYAKGQFSPAGSGRVAQIYAAGPKASCVQAANDAMAGTSYVGTATKFRSVKSGYPGIVIGNHVFW